MPVNRNKLSTIAVTISTLSIFIMVLSACGLESAKPSAPIMTVIPDNDACGVSASDCASTSEESVPPTPSDANGQLYPVDIYMFWGDGCPHCAAAKPFLEDLDKSSDLIELHTYEVWYVEENRTLFTNMSSAFGFEPSGVPTIFLGSQYWEGYNDQIESDIQASVNSCLKNGCKDAGSEIIP